MYEIFNDLLKEKHLKTSDVAKATGIQESFFSNWKQKNHLIHAEKAILIADFLGVSLDFLYRGKDYEKKSDSGKRYYFSDATAEIAETISARDDLRELFSIARNLNERGTDIVISTAFAIGNDVAFSYEPKNAESYPVLDGNFSGQVEYPKLEDLREAQELDNRRGRIKKTGASNQYRKAEQR